MRVDLAKIPSAGMRFSGEEDVVLAAGQEGLEPMGPVSYSLRAQYVTGELILEGEISVPVKFFCTRCVEEFTMKVQDGAFFLVKEAPDKNVSVDLTGDVREAILCAFPSHPVCSSECRGLCPQCGVNRNKVECKCSPVVDARWNGLNGLKL